MRPILKQFDLFPPPGGWGVSIQIRGQTFEFLDGNPKRIVADLFEVAQKNGVMSDISEAWDYCNQLWCEKDPQRCPKDKTSPKSDRVGPEKIVSKRHMIMSPEYYGHRIWEWLNTFGMRGMFTEKEWGVTINRITRMLDPAQNPATGCSKCHGEWQRILRDDPPAKIKNQKQAAEWVFRTHNRVNKKLRKKQQDWATMVIQNGWDIELR